MKEVHIVVGVLAIALNGGAGLYGAFRWWRGERSVWFWRLLRAFGYSFQGFRYTWREEAAFRQEVLLALGVISMIRGFWHLIGVLRKR